jgi:hypothetical protein
VNTFQGPVPDTTIEPEWLGVDDADRRFDEAQRYIDAHGDRFDDPDGVAADLAELRLVVSGASLANPIRTRLTVHRLRRTSGGAAPVAAVISLVRDLLGTG